MIDRLRRRKLLQWVLPYLAGAWLLLQVLDLVLAYAGLGRKDDALREARGALEEVPVSTEAGAWS